MEAHEHYDALDENQRLAMEAESRRLALLEDEAKTAARHVHNIEKTQEEMFGKYIVLSYVASKVLCCKSLKRFSHCQRQTSIEAIPSFWRTV